MCPWGPHASRCSRSNGRTSRLRCNSDYSGRAPNNRRYLKKKKTETASWSSGNAFVSWAGGQRFESRAGQISHSLPMASHGCDNSLKDVSPRRNDAVMGFANSLHAIRRNTASIMKHLSWKKQQHSMLKLKYFSWNTLVIFKEQGNKIKSTN